MAFINGKKSLQVVKTQGVAVDVEANPAGTATDTLEKIKIDDTIYAVEGGASQVDDELSTTSVLPVQNKVVTAALNERAKTEDLENGSVVVSKTLSAKQLENVSEESGSTQTDPFIFQGTGTNNNSSETPTAPVAKQLELRGNSVVVNQIAKELNSTNWNTSNATATYSDGVATFTATAENGQLSSTNFVSVANHKYLLVVSIKLTTATTSVYVYNNVAGGTDSVATQNTIDWQTISILATATQSDTSNVIIRDKRTSDWDAIQTKNVRHIDLTKWFGSNDLIPTDLLNNPSKFGNYYNGSLAYNEGEIVSANATELHTIGFNQFDLTTNEARLLGGYQYEIVGSYTSVSYSTGETITISDGYFTPSQNGILTVTGGNSTTCIHLVWDGQRDGEYEAYTKKVYALGNDFNGKSAGTAYDVKLPSGEITRNVGTKAYSSSDVTEFGTTYENVKFFSIPQPSDYKYYGEWATNTPFISSKFEINTGTIDSVNTIGKIVWNTSRFSWQIGFALGTTLEQAQTAINGLVINYELATPTTEQGTPFAENIEVDDYGTMEFNVTTGVPQGNKFFYPADYVLLVDDLGNYTDYDVTKLAKKTDLNYKELDLTNVGAITSTEIVSGAFYRNNIAITSGLTNAIDVRAKMSNGAIYPMINNAGTQLVVFNTTNFETANITVTKIYYKE